MPTQNNPFELIIIPSSTPSAWPLAPIYWLILVLFTLLIGISVWLIKRHIKQQKIIKKALLALQGIKQNPGSFTQLNQLMKGIALQYYPRTEVAALSGESWLQFLQAHSKNTLFNDKEIFCRRLYQEDSSCTEKDIKQVQQWIKDFPKQVRLKQQSKPVTNRTTGKKDV